MVSVPISQSLFRIDGFFFDASLDGPLSAFLASVRNGLSIHIMKYGYRNIRSSELAKSFQPL